MGKVSGENSIRAAILSFSKSSFSKDKNQIQNVFNLNKMRGHSFSGFVRLNQMLNLCNFKPANVYIAKEEKCKRNKDIKNKARLAAKVINLIHQKLLIQGDIPTPISFVP